MASKLDTKDFLCFCRNHSTTASIRTKLPRMSLCRRWKPVFLTACVVVIGVAANIASVPTADAAKIRKKPPKHPLSPPVVMVDAGKPASEEQHANTANNANTANTAAPAVAKDAGPSVLPGRDPVPAIPYPTSDLICLYGEERDPETQAVRCLSPEELDPPLYVQADTRALAEQLGLKAASVVPTPDAGVVVEVPDVGTEPEPEENSKVRVVSVSFENGAVGGAQRNLRSMTDDFVSCVDDNGGLRVQSARLKLMFFVRSNQKASSMIVGSARNVPNPIVRCIRKVIEDGVVGRPSTDAVGVTVLFELKKLEP